MMTTLAADFKASSLSCLAGQRLYDASSLEGQPRILSFPGWNNTPLS